MRSPEEIQKEIAQLADDRRVFERIKNELTASIARLVKQKAEIEAEKPKLGHGDFGITTKERTEGGGFVIIQPRPYSCAPEPYFKDGLSDGCEYAKNNPNDYTVFGNIFGLMRDWNEPFGENVCIHGIRIEKSNASGADIFIGSVQHLGLDEAYEFWCKLGHKIMFLKRKQS